MTTPIQTYANHRRIPPATYVAGVVLSATALVISTIKLGGLPSWEWAVALLLSAGLLCTVILVRSTALVLQDRVIRAEMRARLGHLLPGRSDAQQLPLKQLVTLRFASDAELPALVDQVVAGKLTTGKDIKLAIKDWQGDWQRV